MFQGSAMENGQYILVPEVSKTFIKMNVHLSPPTLSQPLAYNLMKAIIEVSSVIIPGCWAITGESCVTIARAVHHLLQREGGHL